MKSSLDIFRPGRVLLYGLIIFFAGLTVLPFAWMVCASLKTQADFFTSRFLPTGDGIFGIAWDRLTLHQFVRLFTELPVARALLNSVFFSAVISLGATFFSAAGGYALSKFDFRGREWVTTFTIGTVVLPSALLLGPGFETLYHLGLVDSYAGVLLPGLAPAFGLYLFRPFLRHRPRTRTFAASRAFTTGRCRTKGSSGRRPSPCR